MDTLTPDETSLSIRSVTTGIVAASLSAVLVAPALVVPAYGRVLITVLLAGCTAAGGRLLAATAVAAGRRDPPAAPPREEWPSVSLVVTAYNEADVLGETIDACTGVDYPADRLEVIVGYESASTDGTAAVAEAAAEADPRVTAVERTAPPGGKASATNDAMAAATGEVVAVLDADQRLEPGAVARAVRWFAGDESVWCVKGRCRGTNPRESLVALVATVERNLVERTEFVARDRLGGFAIFTGGQAFVRRAALDAVGRFDESVLLEDLDMAYRLQRAGGTVRVDPGVVTAERNPVGVSAWWHQRKRWARGGMQVARRYLGTDLLSGPPGIAARVDFAATLGALLTIPLLVLAAPVGALVGWNGYAPPALAGRLWAFVFLAPLAASYATLAVDAREGQRRDAVEYAGPLLLWPYVFVQTQAIVASFLGEFVLRRPTRYVTSASDDTEG
ncbi:glycosyltransferase family 2 protein [Halorubrum sp. CSM-61]|uniref:glycosyltransferase n=1 Tax=Halorubrum sp. CSM-61 TaxID=2485838 RepID=UPI000F4BD406|nr:glycosyltransferase family 2 protein [Halorubrum sp. CSM-61]